MLPVSNSMRNNYAGGVEEYYTQHASSNYRNPHYPGIVKTLATFLDVFAAAHPGRLTWHILDLAAGSGEATEAVYTWQKRARQRQKPCPSEIKVVATDPFTGPAFKARTGSDCLPLSFSDVANGLLPSPPEVFDLVICSFALHLLTEPSQLWSLLSTLSSRARWFVVLAPHKKPSIKQEWGWIRADPWTMAEVDDNARPDIVGGKRGDGWEIYEERVRLRVWKSAGGWDDQETQQESEEVQSGTFGS